jgi:hypothetical protein
VAGDVEGRRALQRLEGVGEDVGLGVAFIGGVGISSWS